MMKKLMVLTWIGMMVMVGATAQDFSAVSFDSSGFSASEPVSKVEFKTTVVVETVPVFSTDTIETAEAEALFKQAQEASDISEISELKLSASASLDPRLSIQSLRDEQRGEVERLHLVKLASKENTTVYFDIAPKIKDHYITYDPRYTSKMDKELWTAWTAAFGKYRKPVRYVPYEVPDVRWLFEVRIPENAEQRNNLFAELDYHWDIGYRGIVVVWDGRENYRELVDIQTVLKIRGWKIWLAFSTDDYLHKSCYVDPTLYAKGLKELAKNSEAFLMGWRRTSMHLFIPDEGWTQYTMHSLREGNPTIAFIGEYYFGYNGTDKEGEFHAYVNIPANTNLVLVVNLGYLRINPENALALVRKKVDKKIPVICMIHGETSYFLSRNNTGRTYAVNKRIYTVLEQRFLRKGFDGVARCAGDGGNGMYNGQGFDNLCLSKNRKEIQ